MHEIRIKVNCNGTLSTNGSVIKLGTEQERKRTKLYFDIDFEIEGTYYYVKFKHKKATYLYRASSITRSLIVPNPILTYEGKWLISFISTDSVITTNMY